MLQVIAWLFEKVIGKVPQEQKQRLRKALMELLKEAAVAAAEAGAREAVGTRTPGGLL